MMTRNEQGKGHCFYIYSFKLTREVRIFLKKYNSFFEENSIESAICNTALNVQYDYSFIEKETGNCILYIITHIISVNAGEIDCLFIK